MVPLATFMLVCFENIAASFVTKRSFRNDDRDRRRTVTMSEMQFSYNESHGSLWNLVKHSIFQNVDSTH